MAADAYKNVISDEQFRMFILERDMAKSDRVTEINEAKREGVQEGIQEGIREGTQKEREKNVLMLFESGLDIEKISVILALDKDYVKSLVESKR